MGYDWNWKNLGSWKATNPNYQIKIKTTKGPELWIDGSIPSGWIKEEKWRRRYVAPIPGQMPDADVLASHFTTGVSIGTPMSVRIGSLRPRGQAMDIAMSLIFGASLTARGSMEGMCSVPSRDGRR